MSVRYDDWKATYLENRAHQLQVWREPLVHLRMPLLFNLRRDPFEKAYENSNTYHDWMIDRAYVLGPMQVVASKFLTSMREFPPSQGVILILTTSPTTVGSTEKPVLTL